MPDPGTIFLLKLSHHIITLFKPSNALPSDSVSHCTSPTSLPSLSPCRHKDPCYYFSRCDFVFLDLSTYFIWKAETDLLSVGSFPNGHNGQGLPRPKPSVTNSSWTTTPQCGSPLPPPQLFLYAGHTSVSGLYSSASSAWNALPQIPAQYFS